MQIEQIVTFIHTVPIFHDLPREQLERLAAAASVRDCAAGETLMEPAKKENELFIVVEGEYRLCIYQEEVGLEKELDRLWPGDYFGAIAVVTGRHPTATIRTVTAGRVIVLSQATVDDLFENSPVFARSMCRSLAANFQESIDRLGAIPFVALDSYLYLSTTVHMIPPRISRACLSLAVERDDDRVTVAMVNPGDMRVRTFLVDVLREYNVEFVAVTADDYQQHAAMHLGSEAHDTAPDEPFESLAYVDSTGKQVDIVERGEEDILSRVLTSAIRSGASDVHVEPGNDSGRIRLRIDGRMLPIEDGIQPQRIQQITSRIKVMSNLDITKTRKPQDGRFLILADSRRVEFRVSITPCLGGDKVVLRVVAPNPDFHLLGNLILCETAAVLAQEVLENPNGLTLVTGPTGSGKTTTLYAALKTIESRDHARNFVTIEDPVEYDLGFATQIQVNSDSGMGFANILRTVLRQDPDTILVGEIRDIESAAIAVEAATTGHLVLSSLHTYTALETLVRLRNLDVKPYMLASALKGVISQQLVPRLCPGCTVPVSDDDAVIGRLKDLGVLEGDWSGVLHRGDPHENHPPGGEQGRVGAFEILSMTDRLRDLIDRSSPMSDTEAVLDSECFFPFTRYCGYLLGAGLTAPERIVRMLPKKRGAFIE